MAIPQGRVGDPAAAAGARHSVSQGKGDLQALPDALNPLPIPTTHVRLLHVTTRSEDSALFLSPGPIIRRIDGYQVLQGARQLVVRAPVEVGDKGLPYLGRPYQLKFRA